MSDTASGTVGRVADAAQDRIDDLLARQAVEWRGGRAILVEELVAGEEASPDPLLELIVSEDVLRRERGQAVGLAEFQRRFPSLAEELRIQWEVDRLLFSRISTFHGRSAASARADRIGRYEIQGVLGKGGMGVAYRAYDPDLKRVVALKTLKAGDDAGPEERDRFRAEAEAIARVRHPFIVEVYDVGEQDGLLYFTMEYCESGSLASRLDGNPLPAKEAATLMRCIARGVAAAHGHRVIHRDLKPGNVLLSTGRAGGGSTSGGSTATDADTAATVAEAVTVPKVTDFGLAKRLDADDGQTRSGAVMGTPSYMAPEQAFGEAKRVGPAADVYSLGAILYEMLTGRPPFKGVTVADTLDQVRHRQPVAVRQLQPGAPLDLETIAMKCLAKNPAERYVSAEAVADELERFLDGRPILARPMGPLGRAWRWCRRNPVVASLTLGVFLSLTAGLIGMTILYRGSEANRLEAEENFRETFRAVDDAFTRISESALLREPGTEALREELLGATVPYMERFVEKRKDDPAMRVELGSAVMRLALVKTASGKVDEAREMFHRAIDLADKRVAKNPADVPAARLAARARLALSPTLVRAEDNRAARELVAAALRIIEGIPADRREPAELAACRARLAELSSFLRLPGAEDEFRKSLDEFAADLVGEPDGRDLLAHAAARLSFGQFLLERNPAEAQGELTAALDLFRKAAAKNPSLSLLARRESVKAESLLGDMFAALEDPAVESRKKAATHMTAAVRNSEALIRQSPLNAMYRQEHVVVVLKAAAAHRGWGMTKETLDLVRQGLDDATALRRSQPRNPAPVVLSWKLRHAAAAALSNAGDWKGAEPFAVAGLADVSSLFDADKTNVVARSETCDALRHLGYIRLNTGRPKEAIAGFEAALAIAPADRRALLERDLAAAKKR